MVQAVRTHGIFKGTIMGLARNFRSTHIFFMGGSDPVPDVFSWKEIRNGYIIFRNPKRHKPDEKDDLNH